MFQVPVKDVVKIRRSRKKVKNILCDIALQDCRDLINEYKDFDAGESSFNNTKWLNLTDGHFGKRRKKWRYRTEALCCSLCYFSTRSFYTFRSHVQRCHDEERDLASLSNCPKCTFIGHPKITGQHIKYFHTAPPTKAAPTVGQSALQPAQGTSGASGSNPSDDRYTCVSCGYSDSLLYVMKKHVLVNHHSLMLNRYFGQWLETVQTKPDCISMSKYYCKECKLPAETIEHLLYHILSSDKHKELHWHIMPLIRVKQGSTLNAGQASLLKNQVGVVSRPNLVHHTQAKSNGTVLLTGPTSTSALLCPPGGKQVFLSSQTSSLLPGTTVATLQNSQQRPTTSLHHTITTLPNSQVVKSLVLPGLTQNVAKQLPMTMTVPRLLTPGVQVNLPGKANAHQSLLMTHRLQLKQTNPRPPIMASPSVRLIPTGNKVNGVPTYTLAPVDMSSMSFQGKSSQGVIKTTVASAQNGSPSGRSKNSPVAQSAKALLSGLKGPLGKNKQPNKLAVFAPFLKKQNDETIRCLKCKVLLTEQWIFQHLLHGLKCLFCPLIFYSFKQVMDHSNKEHNLKIKANRDFIKKEFKLGCDTEGNLEFATFSLNTNVPKDLLDNQELNLVLVTEAQEKIYIKMYPDSAKAVYPPTLKAIPTDCPVCHQKLQDSQFYENHLKTVHHIVPTVHAILKSPAFKCIYCFGVYSEKSTPKTISIHVQRCRCAPKSVKDAERKLNPDTLHLNGNLKNSIQPMGAFLPQDKPKKEAGSLLNKNAKARKSDASSAAVRLLLDPTGMEQKSYEDRKLFLTKYFHIKPYLSRLETICLAARLWLNKTDVLAHFSMKRSRCMKTIQKRKTVILLGFNMHEVKKVKHNLLIPEVQSANSLKPEAMSASDLSPEMEADDKLSTEVRFQQLDLKLEAAGDLKAELTSGLVAPASHIDAKTERNVQAMETGGSLEVETLADVVDVIEEGSVPSTVEVEVESAGDVEMETETDPECNSIDRRSESHLLDAGPKSNHPNPEVDAATPLSPEVESPH